MQRPPRADDRTSGASGASSAAHHAQARSWARQEQGARALEKLTSFCEEEGIPVLPVKGILTARLFYEDPSERWIQDVDVRVRPEDLGRLRARARERGIRELAWSPSYCNLVLELEGLMVEVECHVGPPALCGLSVREMLGRATESTEHLPFRHLEPELHDHGLLLCINAFKDKLAGALEGAVSDLARLPGQPGFDPDRLARLARDAEVATILAVTSRWMSDVVGATGWTDVERALGTVPRPHYARLFQRLAARSGAASSPPLLLRVVARDAADTLPRRVRVARSALAHLFERGRLAPTPRRV